MVYCRWEGGVLLHLGAIDGDDVQEFNEEEVARKLVAIERRVAARMVAESMVLYYLLTTLCWNGVGFVLTTDTY